MGWSGWRSLAQPYQMTQQLRCLQQPTTPANSADIPGRWAVSDVLHILLTNLHCTSWVLLGHRGCAGDESTPVESCYENLRWQQLGPQHRLRVRDGTQILASGDSESRDRLWPVAGAHGVALEPGLKNAGVGGMNVSSMSAMDTGWYVPSGLLPDGGPNDDVRWRGIPGLARQMLTRRERFLFRPGRRSV